MRRVTEHKIRSIKKIIFILFALTLLMPASAPLAGVYVGETTIFFDDFESYPEGGWPKGWYTDCPCGTIACGPAFAKVSTDYAFSGTKSLALKAGGIYHEIPDLSYLSTTNTIGFEFSVMVTGQSFIDLYWDAGTGYRRGIDITFLDHEILVGGEPVGTWTEERWYRIKVIDSGGGLEIWVNGELRGKNILPELEDSCSTNRLSIIGGGAYIDDIRVFTLGYTPPQVSIDVFTDKGGKGTDPDGGFYNIGDDITIYCSIDRDVDFLKVWVEKPDGTSVTLHSGSAKAGTYRFPGKVGEPAGERKVKAFAYVAGETFSDEVRFYVSETKKPPEQGCKIDITELYSEPEEIYVGDTFCISGRIKNVGSAGICSFGWFVLDWSPRENLEPRGIIACSPYGREAKLGEEVTPSTCPRPCFKALKPGRVKITVGATACSDYSLCSADYLPRGCCECSETATYCNTTEVIEVVVKQKLGRLTHFDLDYHGNPPNSDGNDQTSITVSPGAKLRIFFRYDEGTSGTPYIIRVYAEWDKKNYLANSDGNEAYPEEGGMEIGGFRWDVEEYTVPTTPGVYKVRVVYSKSSVPPTWDNYDILLAEGTIVVQSQENQKPTA